MKKLDQDLIDSFLRDGYVVIPPGKVFSEIEIDHMLSMLDATLPSYTSGEVNPNEIDASQNPLFEYAAKIGNVNLYGCALSHRYSRGHGSPVKEKNNNYLFGKRAIIPERLFPKEFYRYLESDNLTGFIKAFLKCDDISFHNASLVAVYPGCTGESRQLHIDTPGFLRNRGKLLDPGRFLVNAMIYLDDVTLEMAPMRVVARSHSRYFEINDQLSKSFGKSKSLNNVPQAGDFWDELLPKDIGLADPIKLTGKKGTVIFMNSSLLHAATENYSKELVRKVVISNFSNHSHKEFHKKYSFDPKGCSRVYKSFLNKKMVETTFFKNAGYIKYYKYTAKKYSAVLRSYLNAHIDINSKRFRKVIDYPFWFNLSGEKKYLNIGSGINWKHANVIGLDYDSEKSELSIDLNSKGNLPFTENYFFGIYSSHCLEHLKESQVIHWLSEAKRCLSKGGVLRLTVPNIWEYFDHYEALDASYFDWIRNKGTYRFDSWLRLIVRAFAEPVVDRYSDEDLYKLYSKLGRLEFLNYFSKEVESFTDSRFLGPNCHKSWWSPQKMTATLKKIGFENILISTPKSSSCRVFRGVKFDNTSVGMSFFIEAKKG